MVTEARNEIDVQPHNIDAERAMLGAMLIDPDAILRIREIVTARDLYIERHRLMYSAYLTAVDNGNDAPTYIEICDILERQGKLEDVGQAYITSLMGSTPTALNAHHYAEIVARTGYLRRAITAAQRIAQLAYLDDEAGIDTTQEQIERIVFDLAPVNDGDGFEHISETTREIYDEMDRRQNGQLPPGVKTGFKKLDEMTGGLQKSDFIIIAARPSMGKTSLMLDIARNASQKHHKRVAFFSLEMSKAQIVQRLIASKTEISTTTLRTGKLREGDWTSFIAATGALDNSGLYIDDAASLSASKMSAKLRRLLAQVGIDLIVIDYLQCMRVDGRQGDLYQKTSRLTKDCKWLAKTFNLPVVVGSQLSRACEQRADKRPMLSDLRDSGTIEEDADIVAFIYRDDYYNEDSETPNLAEINIAKHRNGPTGMFPLYFNERAATFAEIELQRVEF